MSSNATLAFLLALSSSWTVAGTGAGPPRPELDALLTRLARVAELYRDNALGFTCRETVQTEGPRVPRSLHRYTYIYRVGGNGLLADDRTELEGTSRARPPAEFLRRAYSWIFVFEQEVADRYEFELLEDGRALEREALRVRFSPRGRWATDPDHWYGIAWIDRSTLQFLHVEAVNAMDRLSERGLRRMLAEPAEDGERGYQRTFTFSTVTTRFGVHENGMRFPSRVEIERADHEVRTKRGTRRVKSKPVFSIVQSYEDYRFFGVRTEEQIRSIVGVD